MSDRITTRALSTLPLFALAYVAQDDWGWWGLAVVISAYAIGAASAAAWLWGDHVDVPYWEGYADGYLERIDDECRREDRA